MFQAADVRNFVGGFYFEVSFETESDDVSPGEINQSFTRVSGVVSQSEQMEFMQGTDPFVMKAPGRSSFEDVTLERVYNGQDAFYKWRKAIQGGAIIMGTVHIRIYKRDGTEIRHMVCDHAWPSRWEMPELDASGSGPAIERITLTVREVYEGEVAEAEEAETTTTA